MKINATHTKSVDDISSRPVPGTYRVIVANVDEFQKDNRAVIVELKIQSGTVPGQDGKTITHYMWLNDKNEPTDAILKFAIVTGLIQPGTEADVDFSHALGSELVIELEERESKKDGKKYINIGNFGLSIWPLDHPEVPSSLKQSPARSTAQTPPKPQQPQQPQQQPATASPSGWDDI